MTSETVRRLLQAKADELLSHERLAREIGISRQMVSLVLAGERAPSPKMLDYLGLERRRITSYYWRRGHEPAASLPAQQARTSPHGRQTPR